MYWSHFAEKRGGSLQNAPPPNLTHKMARGILKVFGVSGFLVICSIRLSSCGCCGWCVVGVAGLPSGVHVAVSSFTAPTCCAISTKHARANMVGYWDGGEIEMS